MRGAVGWKMLDLEAGAEDLIIQSMLFAAYDGTKP